MNQIVLRADNGYRDVEALLRARGVKALFVVCDGAMRSLAIRDWLASLPGRLGIRVTSFSDFRPNPTFDSVLRGIAAFRRSGADWIFAVGGGSAIDVAKCIKLFCLSERPEDALRLPVAENGVTLMAMPTTAGTGSEATRFAVVYDGGEKQSVDHESCITSVVLFDPGALATLPPYQKKATALDALCHATESFWSVHGTQESEAYAAEALRLILEHLTDYLAGGERSGAAMLRAANLAGKAINITQTTAGHAMCYKLTALGGIAHGHAAALCVRVLFPWLAAHTDRCIDSRGEEHLRQTLRRLAGAMGCETPEAAADRFAALTDSLDLPRPALPPDALGLLVRSVNPVRLKNFPALLTPEDIDALYRQILNGD